MIVVLGIVARDWMLTWPLTVGVDCLAAVVVADRVVFLAGLVSLSNVPSDIAGPRSMN